MKHERILYEDNDVIICHKPAGIATQTARVGQADMVSEISNYLKTIHPEWKEAPYVGVVHRLDQPVEGILIFAKNKAAAADLSRQAAGSGMKKEYLAVVCGEHLKRTGELKDYLLKDGKTNTSRIGPRRGSLTKSFRKGYPGRRLCEYDWIRGGIIRSGYRWRMQGCPFWGIANMPGRRRFKFPPGWVSGRWRCARTV